MSVTHTVKKGESLSTIARHYGVGTWKDIYHAPQNAQFRSLRTDPNLIYPGDVVIIPDDVSKSLAASTGATHRFVFKRSAEIILTSTFAFDQLHLIARKDSLVMFMVVYMDIFGTDIPADAYEALYNDAQAKADILRPEIQVQSRVPYGAQACFDGKTSTITIAESLVLNALNDNETRGKLMAILVEEYGHYLDHLLRHHYSVTERSDAEGDEGAKFAYKMYQINPVDDHEQHFADVRVDGMDSQLIWDFSVAHEEIKNYVNERRQARDDKVGELEFFKAGKLTTHGHYGHQDLTELAMRDLLERHVDAKSVQKKLDIIYLGNWMRDFSQALDPSSVRPASTAMMALARKSSTTTPSEQTTSKIQLTNNRWIELRPVRFSVEGLTSAIELMAVKEFIHQDGKATTTEDYDAYLEKMRTEYVEINTQTLGVYRPEEHIDNPKGIGHDDNGGDRGDKQLYGKFIGYVPDAHPLNLIETHYGLKTYIRSKLPAYVVDGDACATSYTYIVRQLKASGVSKGLGNPKALVAFGAAMHTLEDYFAHSNFVEISLIKSVEPAVFPWVDEVAATGWTYEYKKILAGGGYTAKHYVLADPTRLVPGNELARCIPVVTGTFGLVDTAASVLPILNQHVFNVEIKPWTKAVPGERTFADVLIRELLKDLDHVQQDDANKGSNDTQFADLYEKFLQVRDVAMYAKDVITLDVVEQALHVIMQHIERMLNLSEYFTVATMVATINDAQVALDKDLSAMEAGKFHIGIDPSHTQVAKDDPMQPLHELAALLAGEAVRRVGTAMIRVWQGQATVETDVLPVLDRLVRHPCDSDWQDEIVINWAKAHPNKVCAACSPSIVIERVLAAIGEIDNVLNDANKYLKNETTIEKALGYVTSSDAAKQEVKQLKTTLSECITKSIAQLERANKVRKVWETKYPKPSYCASTSGVGLGVKPRN